MNANEPVSSVRILIIPSPVRLVMLKACLRGTLRCDFARTIESLYISTLWRSMFSNSSCLISCRGVLNLYRLSRRSPSTRRRFNVQYQAILTRERLRHETRALLQINLSSAHTGEIAECFTRLPYPLSPAYLEYVTNKKDLL